MESGKIFCQVKFYQFVQQKHHEAEQKRAQERISELEAAVAAKEETLSNVAETVQSTQRLSEQLELKNVALSRLQQKLTEKDTQLQAAFSKCREAEGAEGRVEKYVWGFALRI